MSYATRTYLSHTVFWHVLENNSVNQGCFEFWSKYASGNIEENFPNASNSIRPTRRVNEESRSKIPWKNNVNRVHNLVRTVKLSISESLLKVGPLSIKLKSLCFVGYLSEKMQNYSCLIKRNMWHLGILSSGLEFKTRAFRIWSKFETQLSPTLGQSGWKNIRPINSGIEKAPKTFCIFAAIWEKIWIQRQFSLEWKNWHLKQVEWGHR
jgi:hypothetical protein